MLYTQIQGQKLSQICLGTMMWGDQVTETEAQKQMALALDQGVNFWDTAEVYTVPTTPATYGKTETFIGNFFAQKPEARSQVFLASKFCARGVRELPWIRGGQHFADGHNIDQALTSSLQRLQTDHIDLYQIHWPDRAVNAFGQRNYLPGGEQGVPIRETAEALLKEVQKGRIRFVGISNETPWGMMEWTRIAKEINLPLLTIQNPYSLLNRLFEIGHSEISLRENLPLIPYSPLAMGTLSGKYLNTSLPPKGSRRDLFPGYASRFASQSSDLSTQEYVQIAQKHNLDPSQMALAFVRQQPFVLSTIIGVTSCEQLQSNIDSVNLTLSQEVLDDIEKIYQRYPDPCA